MKAQRLAYAESNPIILKCSLLTGDKAHSTVLVLLATVIN
jgi:hypothetical protein